MTEVDIELQELRREVKKLLQENEDLRNELVVLSKESRKLHADKESLESLHYLDQSEIVWLRRTIESMVENGKETNRWPSST